MATPEDLIAQNQLLNQQVQQQAALMQQIQQQVASLQAEIQATVATTPVDDSQRPAFAVDTRTIGKPKEFDGEQDWKGWSFVFRAYAAASHDELGYLMRAAELSEDPVANVHLGTNEKHTSTQLYYMLVMVCWDRH